MKHRVKVTASWWVDVDDVGVGVGEEHYEDLLFEKSIDQVIDHGHMVEKADWAAELVE